MDLAVFQQKSICDGDRLAWSMGRPAVSISQAQLHLDEPLPAATLKPNKQWMAAAETPKSTLGASDKYNGRLLICFPGVTGPGHTGYRLAQLWPTLWQRLEKPGLRLQSDS